MIDYKVTRIKMKTRFLRSHKIMYPIDKNHNSGFTSTIKILTELTLTCMGGGGLYTIPSAVVFCPFLKLSQENPYPKILEFPNFFFGRRNRNQKNLLLLKHLFLVIKIAHALEG